MTKLFICLFLYTLQSPGRDGFRALFSSITWSESRLFAVPALIYLINDNLVFVIFSMVDPTSFEILGNMRIISTALLFNYYFKRRLHHVQQSALFLLCIGTAVSQLVTCESHIISGVNLQGFLLVILYCFLSGFGGVYTEYLMKRQSAPFLYQNIQLYFYSVLLNFLVLGIMYPKEILLIGPLQLAGKNMLTGFVILNQALSGLAVAAIVKYADNIARVYAHSISMLLTMLVSSIIYRDFPSMQLIFGIAIVSISIYLYYTPEMRHEAEGKIITSSGHILPTKESIAV